MVAGPRKSQVELVEQHRNGEADLNSEDGHSIAPAAKTATVAARRPLPGVSEALTARSARSAAAAAAQRPAHAAPVPAKTAASYPAIAATQQSAWSVLRVIKPFARKPAGAAKGQSVHSVTESSTSTADNPGGATTKQATQSVAQIAAIASVKSLYNPQAATSSPRTAWAARTRPPRAKEILFHPKRGMSFFKLLSILQADISLNHIDKPYEAC